MPPRHLFYFFDAAMPLLSSAPPPDYFTLHARRLPPRHFDTTPPAFHDTMIFRLSAVRQRNVPKNVQ